LKRRPAKPASDGVLFAVTGMSPAVLTETVWALAHQSPPVIPSRVVVLTTTIGRDAIVKALLTPTPAFGNRSVWSCLRTAIETDGFDLSDRLRFGSTGQDICVFTSADSRGISHELADIATPGDNAAAADFILEHLRRFVEDPDVPVIASIAGGRKTMGALLFACMTLVGRETDRLTHVLVDPQCERTAQPGFFFPGQPAILRTQEGKPVRLSRTPVTLSDIPFVPLRNRFRELENVPGTYLKMVQLYSRGLKHDVETPVQLQMDAAASTVVVDGISVVLRRRAYYTLEFLTGMNQTVVPVPRQLEAIEPFRDFLARHPEQDAVKWSGNVSVDDLKRELNYIRTVCSRKGLTWQPGLRQNSLKLPPFILKRGSRAAGRSADKRGGADLES